MRRILSLFPLTMLKIELPQNSLSPYPAQDYAIFQEYFGVLVYWHYCCRKSSADSGRSPLSRMSLPDAAPSLI